MVRKGLQIINVIALILSGLTYSWMYTEHSDMGTTQNEQVYQQKIMEINQIASTDDLKKSYIDYVNSSKNDKRVHNYSAEKYTTSLLVIIALLGLNFVFLIILNEQARKNETQ